MLYQPLPTDESIRMLHFDVASSSLECSVTVLDLNGEINPPYTCLSYTWGSPYPPCDPRSAWYQPDTSSGVTQPVLHVDGWRLKVTRSLYEALEHLKRDQPGRLKAIWIDAVCIDQRPEGVAERGKQVAMMDRIYATAEHVLVWLGPCDDGQAYAVGSSLKDLSSVSTNTLELAQMDGSLDILLPSTYQKLGITFIPQETWKYIRELFERGWFARMWVTQEAALAQSLSFHFGKQRLTWEELERATMLIYRLGKFFADICTPPSGIVERIIESDKDLRKTESSCMAWNSLNSVRLFRTELSRLSNSTSRFTMRDQHAAGASMIATRDWIGNPQAWRGFRTFIQHKSRRKKASDPRDKIYALLGLLQGMIDEKGNRLITPDYSEANNVRTMYTSITRKFFEESSGNFWGAAVRVPPVEDSSNRNVESLPSWVPDYSAADAPLHLTSAAMFHFKASAHLIGGTFDTGDLYTWGVWGLVVDTVDEIGESYEEMKTSLSLRRSLKLLEALPVDHDTEKSKGSRLLRTLVASLSLGAYITAREELGIFRSYLTLLEATRLQEHAKSLKGHSDNNLCNLEQNYKVLGSELRPTTSSILDAYHAIQDPASSHSALLKDLVTRASQYEASLDRMFSCRRVFITKCGRLGIGPCSLRKGDQVWLIPPERTPHILRLSGREGDYRFRLIGDAYVDGIMYGEAAMAASERDLKGIMLV